MASELGTPVRSNRTRQDAAAVDTMASLLLVVTADGTIRRTNPAFESALGYTHRESKGLKLLNTLVPPEDVDVYQQAMEHLRKGKSDHLFEGRLLNKNGDRPKFNWVGTSILGDGAVIEAIVFTGIPVNVTGGMGQEVVLAKKEMEAIPGSDDHNERRREKRRAYPYQQLIAPIYDNEMPERDDFIKVRCHGISPGGFSYTLHGPPRYEQLVIAFGTAPTLTYIKAEVRHVSPVIQNGVQQFVVGCKFIGRINF